MDIKGSDGRLHFNPENVWEFFGTFSFILGLIITLSCILNFAIQGRGTLSPLDPTKKLVVGGLYRFSRNPMYVGVAAILLGEAIFSKSVDLSIYLTGVCIAFDWFIRFREEPRLLKDFGKEYQAYCRKVRRWI